MILGVAFFDGRRQQVIFGIVIVNPSIPPRKKWEYEKFVFSNNYFYLSDRKDAETSIQYIKKQ